MCFLRKCTRETTSLGLKIKRRNNNQFFSGLRMENHEVQSAKTSLVKELTSPRGMNLWRFQCVLNANHGLKHGHSTASQDLKTKMVMYSSVSNLSGIFRRFCKTNE